MNRSSEKILYTIQPYDSLWLIAQRFNTDMEAIRYANPGLNMNSLFSGQGIYIYPGYKHGKNENYENTSCINGLKIELSDTLRMLWEQHVTWTRLAIVSIVFGLPDVEFVNNRLMRNPKDFEAALIPFYGEKIAGKFADLLTEHLSIAGDLVKAAKAGDSQAAEDAENKWYENADQIASFLANINPFWSEDEWKAMLYDHLAMTKTEAVNMISGDYQAGVDIYDEIEKQALDMADYMTEGIIRQFPDKFSYK